MTTNDRKRFAIGVGAFGGCALILLGACHSSPQPTLAETNPSPDGTTRLQASDSINRPRSDPALVDSRPAPPTGARTEAGPSLEYLDEPPPVLGASEASRDPEASAVPIKHRSDELLVRRDGRPTWWFVEPVENDGRIALCSESLGGSIAEARGRAVEAARERLRTAMNLSDTASLPGEKLEQTWVWPLPNQRVSGAKYACYVMISAQTYR